MALIYNMSACIHGSSSVPIHAVFEIGRVAMFAVFALFSIAFTAWIFAFFFVAETDLGWVGGCGWVGGLAGWAGGRKRGRPNARSAERQNAPERAKACNVATMAMTPLGHRTAADMVGENTKRGRVP